MTVPFEGLDLPVLYDEAPGAGTLMVFAPGVGSNLESKNVARLARLVRECGASTLRFNFPYRVEGKQFPDPMPRLVASYRSVIGFARQTFAPATFVIGGHSMGGRTASMLLAEGNEADGLLLFGYPLHPAKQPSKLRRDHLSSIAAPVLAFSGDRDELCTPAMMEEAVGSLPNWDMEWVEGADHSLLRPGKGAIAMIDSQVVGRLTPWLRGLEAR